MSEHLIEELQRRFKTSLKRMSPATSKAYMSDVTLIVHYIADDLNVPAEKLTAADVFDRRTMQRAFNTFATPEEGKPRGKSSVQRCWSTWNGFARFLVREEVLNANPMDGVIVNIKRQAPTPPKAIERQDVKHLLETLATPDAKDVNAWRERDLSIILLGLLLGLRSAEMINLNIGSFTPIPDNSNARRVTVKGKGEKPRVLVAETRLIELLETYLDSRARRFPHEQPPSRRRRRSVWDRYRPDTPLLVADKPGPDGDPVRITRGTLQYRTLRAYKRAGIPATPGANTHRLRHTYAITLADNMVPIHTLTALLGHSTLSTALKYLEASGQATRNASASSPLYDITEEATSHE